MTARYVRWSDEDKAILREIWKSTESIQSQVHRLPGRTAEHLRQKAKDLGLERKPRSAPGWKRIRDTLAGGRIMTIQDLAEAVHLSTQQVRELLDAAVERGDAHIFDWVRVSRNGHAQKRFKLGSGKNAKAPAHFTHAERQERWESKQDPEELFIRRRRYYTRKLAETGKLVRRDPLTAALFGSV